MDRIHIVSVPWPGRGHVNAMMNVCNLLLSSHQDLLITFVVTEEWLGFLSSAPKPTNIRFRSVPNVIPSEMDRGADWPSFLEAVNIKMGEPFDRLLDGLDQPISCILADTYVPWAVEIGNRRKIPVASLWPMSPSVLSIFHHYDEFVSRLPFPFDELSEHEEEHLECIPGITSIRIANLPSIFTVKIDVALRRSLEAMSWLQKSQFLLLTSFYELETLPVDILRAKLPLPIYLVGPSIPYITLQHQDASSSTSTSNHSNVDYFSWLDPQPRHSVLYVSLGSFLPVSGPQMDEFLVGLRSSGVRFLWVSRGDATQLQEAVTDGKIGLVVSWCDQLKVLCHPSVGGFLTHCGWNSTLEALFAGVPMLTFPLFYDQFTNMKLIVDDWKVGLGLKNGITKDNVIKSDEIAGRVQKFMDLHSNEGKEMRKRATELQEACKRALEKDGSSTASLEAFITNVVQCGTNKTTH